MKSLTSEQVLTKFLKVEDLKHIDKTNTVIRDKMEFLLDLRECAETCSYYIINCAQSDALQAFKDEAQSLPKAMRMLVNASLLWGFLNRYQGTTIQFKTETIRFEEMQYPTVSTVHYARSQNKLFDDYPALKLFLPDNLYTMPPIYLAQKLADIGKQNSIKVDFAIPEYQSTRERRHLDIG